MFVLVLFSLCRECRVRSSNYVLTAFFHFLFSYSSIGLLFDDTQFELLTSNK